MNKKKSGFTLMEIMVVIIVIAVLASVAGPMIGSITDQGRASATKSKMSSLKSALLAFQSDVGRLPFKGNCSRKKGAYCQSVLLSSSCEEQNVLYTNNWPSAAGCQPNNYHRKWKGPYMDSDPSDFMYDSWGNEFKYVAEDKNIYLWSSGPDGDWASTAGAAFKAQGNTDSDTDDIVISVYRAKKSFLNGE